MRFLFTAALLMAAWALPARAELMLFAKYDWQNGALDVSGSPIRHHGMLEPGASIAGGKLLLDRWDGVVLGKVPELNGASQVLFRFENVTLDRHGEPGSEPVGHTPVLFGDDMVWSAAIHYELPPVGNRTHLQFWVTDASGSVGLDVLVADQVVDHFDSIEYRFDGAAPVAERIAMRWNDGPWVSGASGSNSVDHLPAALDVRINNGGPSDWDPFWGSIGTVSLYSNQTPEAGTACGLTLLAALALCRHRRS